MLTSHPPWRGSLFHVIIMCVTSVISMLFCAHPLAISWQFHSPVSPDSLNACLLAQVPKVTPPLKNPRSANWSLRRTVLRYDTIRDASLTCARKPT